MADSDEAFELNLSDLIGATGPASVQVLTLFIPDMDKVGNPVADHDGWVNEAAALLARIGGGVTILGQSRGGWLNDELARTIWEETSILFTYILPDRFQKALPRLRGFLHRFGRETNQGEVAFEFDGSFYRIVKFDEA